MTQQSNGRTSSVVPAMTGTGAAGAGAGIAIVTAKLVTANNPELAPFEAEIAAGVMTVLGGFWRGTEALRSALMGRLVSWARG